MSMEQENRTVTTEGASEGSTRCDACKSCGAILELEGCGHRFHPRCVFTWPITQCEICSENVTTVRIFREFRNLPNSMARKGKWSADEHKYANMMMRQFQLGAIPLVDGLHLRGFIANLLQCDPLRVTKKYSGHSIGKQNFFYQYRKNYCYNLHIKLQKRVSSLRNHFYWHIQYRCRFGYALNVQDLKAAETDYWIREFLKFAEKIGQKVEFTKVPVPSTPIASLTPAAVTPSVQAPIVPPSVSAQEVPIKKEPVYQPFKSIDVFEDADATAPSTDDRRSSVSPLGFDEWIEEKPPAFLDVLDTLTFADYSQGDGASEIPGNKTTTPPRDPTRCSLGDWLKEEESRWNENMTVPSWSFTLSDCA